MRKRYIITGLVLVTAIGWMVRRFATDDSLQHFQSAGFWKTVSGANHFYLLLSMLFISLTYVLRSLRWQVMLRPTKATSLKNVLVGTLIGFALVGVIGRPAEFVRPYLIARKERMAITSQLGAWTLERILDSLAIVSLLGASLWLWPPSIAEGTTASKLLESFREAGMVLLVITVLVAVFLAVLHYRPSTAKKLLIVITQPLPWKIREQLHSTFDHFVSALAVIGDVRNLLLALVSTAIIWIFVLGSYWGAAQAIGSPVDLINLGGLTLVMVASGLGSMAHLPAVGGGIQIATILALTHLFDVPLPIATSMALFVWVITYLLVLIPGLPLAAKEGVSWRGLKSLPQVSE